MNGIKTNAELTQFMKLPKSLLQMQLGISDTTDTSTNKTTKVD